MKGRATLMAGVVAGLTTACLAGGPAVIINEVDADTPGSDVAEFIELYDGGAGGTSLDGLVIVLYNGSNDQSYAAFDLDGGVTDANGYWVVGNAAVPNVDQVIPDGSLQNGADAVALYVGNDTDFPSGTPVTTVNLVDAIVYDTNDGDDAELLVLLNAGQPQVNEGGGPNGSANDSSQRCPNGSGGARNTDTYAQNLPTPGEPNLCEAETGSCCLPDFSCQDDVSEATCDGLGGTWTAFTACIDLDPPCAPPDPTGACCNEATGVCSEGVTQIDCMALGGTYGGDDSLCENIVCEGVEPADLIISEIVDATLPGGQPKWVEITNCSDAAVDLSFYSIGNFNNGGTELGGGASSLLTGVLAAGDSYVVAYENSDGTDCDPVLTCFELVYGFAPDMYLGPFINGDDVVALFLGLATGDGSDAILIDVYGVIGEDGSGTAWEYTDSYSYREGGFGPNPTFDVNEWFVAGADALETGDDAEELVLIQTLTDPGTHDCGSVACPYDLDMSGAVDFGDLLLVLSNWGALGGPEDLDGSGTVDFGDLLLILSNWGPC